MTPGRVSPVGAEQHPASDATAGSAAAASAPPPVPHHHEVLLMLQTTLAFLVAALFVLTFIVQPFRIPSGSMEDTLLIGDFLLVNKIVFADPGPWRHLLAYQPVRRDDIVVFHYPVDHSLHLVKRVIAVPGDRLRLRNGRVFVDGQPQVEPFAVYIPSYPSAFRDNFPSSTYTDAGVNPAWWAEMQHDERNGALVVPKGKYFVLGDNRNDSLDSRYWGFVPRQNIVGQPFLVYFSVDVVGQSEITGLPTASSSANSGDRLDHEQTWWNDLTGWARWGRMFHVIR